MQHFTRIRHARLAALLFLMLLPSLSLADDEAVFPDVGLAYIVKGDGQNATIKFTNNTLKSLSVNFGNQRLFLKPDETVDLVFKGSKILRVAELLQPVNQGKINPKSKVVTAISPYTIKAILDIQEE